MRGKEETEIKMPKPWQSFNDIEKSILIYIAYTSPPHLLDDIISLSGLSPVTALRLLEDLKKHSFVCEKEETGEGAYYPGDIDLQDYTRKNLSQKELSRIVEKVILLITKFHRNDEEKIIALADLYLHTGINGDRITCIKKAADILNHSGKKEKAVVYYDFIIENFLKESMALTQSAPLIEDFLDSVFQRISMVLFYPIILNKQLALLEKAHKIANRLNQPVQLAKIKLLLAFSLPSSMKAKKSSKYINEFWKLIEGLDNISFLKESFFLLIISNTTTGRFSEGIDIYEKMIGNLEKFGKHEVDLLSSLLVALSHVYCGRVSRGMGMIDAIRKKAQLLNFNSLYNHAIFINTIALIGIRRISEAERILQRIFGKKMDIQDNNMKGSLHFCKAFILCLKEDYKRAYEHIKKGFIYRESMGMVLHPYCPWILECLYLIESKGFTNKKTNFDIEIKNALKHNSILIKGAAYRYQALCNMERNQSQESILPDLKLSEKLLKQSGAEIELARTRIVMKNYYIAQGNPKLARSCMEKTWALFANLNEDLFPSDLLENTPSEKKKELVIEKITSINRSLGTVRNRQSLLNTVMNVAMDFTNATHSGVYFYEENNLKLIASRNIDSTSHNQTTVRSLQGAIANTIKRNQEIVHPKAEKTIAEQFRKLGIRSFIGIPIKSNKSIYGYFFIGNHFGREPFPDHVLPLMRMFASQIEVGLSNFSAYEKIKKLKDRFEDEAIFYRREMGLDLPIEQIIGESDAIRKVVEQVRQVASTDSLVLVLGETGVGKELVAKAIHNLSERRDGPFIPVNLSTFPQDLVANELFGHEKGAFSGAYEKKKGRFELADGGTIFLDEIGDLPPDMQTKLLRVLQEGSFERLGGSTTIRSNFRVVVASNKNLRHEVERGFFREDLYYRLNVFPIYVPPLRERKKDIPLLARHFFSIFNKKLNKKIGRIQTEDINKLMSYHWPGNVRELKHFIERAVILFNGNEISFSGLELETSNQPSGETQKVALLADLLADVEREHIEKTLKKTFWKISGDSGAASLLGLPPSTLRHRIRKLGIEKPF